MIIDQELQFADGTWAPTALGDNISPNVLDTSPLGGVPTANGGRDLGQGEGLWLVVTVKTAVTSAGSATVQFYLRTDSAASGTSAPVDLVGSGVISKANLTAGTQIKLKLPSATYKKYIMVNANIGTAVLTAGAFEAEVVKDIAGNTKYAGGYTLDI